jgi:exopolysaccharide biosynthesis polyprenyl glycosylphosphotransferase
LIWRKPSHQRIAQIADFLTSFFGFIISFQLWNTLYKFYPIKIPKPLVLMVEYLLLIGIFSCIYVLLFYLNRAYSYQRFTSLIKEYYIITKVAVQGILICLAIIFAIGYKDVPRTIFVISFVIITIFYFIQKTTLFYLAAFIRKKGKNRKRILVIGTGERSRQFIDKVTNNLGWGLDIIGLLTGDEKKVGNEFFGYRVIDNFNNLTQVLKEYNPQEVIITISTKQFDNIRYIIEVCEREGVQVRLNSDFFSSITKEVRVDNVYGLNIISFSTVRQKEFQIYLKRTLDVVGSLIALILFFPFMLIAALCILICDGPPIIYRWDVIGLDKRPIRSWKFRTMVRNADKLKEKLLDKNEMVGPVFKINDDPRIISCGKWIRKYSIDETPQLISVLKGDLSLVGPRPAGPNELARYESWQRRKLSIKPGLTCLWQINGRSEITNFNEWVKMDLQYIDNWNLWLDIKILFKTLLVVINTKGAR